MNRQLLLIYGSICLIVLLRIVLASPPPEFPDGATIRATVRVVSPSQLSYGHEEVTVMIRGQKVVLVVPQFSQYRYGDLLHISGVVKKRVLDNKKATYSMYFPSIALVKDDVGIPYKLAGWVREKVTEAFTSYLPPDEASLLLGIVFGINSAVSHELKLAFQTTGVTHVVAASGMNVTLLAGFLLPIFLRFWRRQHALLMTILCLFFYALLSGLSASIVRATLMASISYLGLLVGRQRTAFISFFLTGSAMIILSPSVIADIGFQLSFAATAGMLLISPLLPSFAKIPVIGWIEDDLKTTISAQITTLPILLMYFHTFGVFSVLVNALVLWTIPLLMVIGSSASLVALLSIHLGGIIAFVCLPLLSYFIAVIRFFAFYSLQLRMADVPWGMVTAYYLALAGSIWWIKMGKKKNEKRS